MLARIAVGVWAVVLGAALLVSGLPESGPLGLLPTPSPTLATSRPPTSGVVITATPGAPQPIPDGFRIQIPRLGIDLPIGEGVIQRDIEQQQTPEHYAFHLPGSAIPGERGNSYLYAHARRGMFLALWEARVGDVVYISTPAGRAIEYVVFEVRQRVPPEDVSVAQPTADERLTLQTSTGANPEDPRFVVIARPRS